MKLLKTLRESIKENNVDSLHHHLNELERVVQNNERMRRLLEEAGTLSYAAILGSTPVVETLIQKGVGEEKIYYSGEYNHKLSHGRCCVLFVLFWKSKRKNCPNLLLYK